MATMAISKDDTDDLEIVADVVRHARAAPPGTRGRDVIAHVRRNFPDADEPRIRRAAGVAADMLLAQHG